MTDLKAGDYKPFYLLMGEEPYFIDLITDYIMEHALEPDERDFNQNVLYGIDTNCSQIVDMAKGYPMMAERQVLVVKEASKSPCPLPCLSSVIKTGRSTAARNGYKGRRRPG